MTEKPGPLAAMMACLSDQSVQEVRRRRGRPDLPVAWAILMQELAYDVVS